jgi:hypothetical protein
MVVLALAPLAAANFPRDLSRWPLFVDGDVLPGQRRMQFTDGGVLLGVDVSARIGLRSPWNSRFRAVSFMLDWLADGTNSAGVILAEGPASPERQASWIKLEYGGGGLALSRSENGQVRVIYERSGVASGIRRVRLELAPRLRIVENGLRIHEGPPGTLPVRCHLFLQLTAQRRSIVIFEDVSAQ